MASYYTAAFHLTAGILALNGRVLFEDPWVKNSAGSPKEIGYVIGRLTKRNTWKLEARSRSHGRRWAELGQVYREEGRIVDPEFLRLISRLVDYGPHSFGDAATPISESLKAVAELRHEALYQGFGFDRFAFDLADDNRELAHILDQRAKEFREFCLYLMRTVVDGLFDLTAAVPSSALLYIRALLLISVYSPPFEVTRADGIDDTVSAKIKIVIGWLLGEQALNPYVAPSRQGQDSRE